LRVQGEGKSERPGAPEEALTLLARAPGRSSA